MIGIDGACRNNGFGNAVASIGVFFGPESKYNLTEGVARGPFTSQRAELIAAYRALQQVKLFRECKECVRSPYNEPPVSDRLCCPQVGFSICGEGVD